MTDKNRTESEVRERWGNNIVDAGSGWTVIPSYLLEKQQELDLNPVQLNILLVMLMHWWEEDNKPCPSKKSIAKTVGRDLGTVRQHIKIMEEKGLVTRIKRYQNPDDGGAPISNEYDLSGLLSKLNGLAIKDLGEMKKNFESIQ